MEIIIIFVAVMDKSDLILEVERLQDEISILGTDIDIVRSEERSLISVTDRLNFDLEQIRMRVSEIKEDNKLHGKLIGMLYTEAGKLNRKIKNTRVALWLLSCLLSWVLIYLLCR